MWDDMDRLGQPAFHERASKVGSSAVPAHLFHHFPRHGQNMRSWSWIGQFLKFHDEFDVWEFGTAWNLSWKNTPDQYFSGLSYCGGDLCRRWSRFGGLLNQDRHVSILFGLDISQVWTTQRTEGSHPSELFRLTSKSTRSFSEFGETRAPWLVDVGSIDRLIRWKLKKSALAPTLQLAILSLNHNSTAGLTCWFI